VSRINPDIVAAVVLLAVLCFAPFMVSEYRVEVLIIFFINVILVSSYRVATTTGDWTLSHVIFLGVGAYATAIFAKNLGWPFWLTMPMSGVATAAVGLMVAFPLLRTKGFGFFIASFAIGEFMVVALVVIYRLDKSRVGNAWKTIYLDEDLAESIGIHVFHYRATAFTVAAFFAGIAGAMLAHLQGAIDPHNFGVDTMVYLVIWIVVGGNATFWGPIAGVTVMSFIFELSRPLAEWRPLLFGVILIIFLTVLPGGLEMIYERIRERLFGERERAG
jgi:branched-chain amino acid transport system permease protein